MRQLTVPLLVAMLLAAGCLGHSSTPTDKGKPGTGGPGQEPGPATPPGSPFGGNGSAPAQTPWKLDCTLGAATGGTGWNQTCVARASHSPRTKAEMWVGINPTDPRNVVVAAKDLNPESSKDCVWNGLFVTKDGGATWTEVTIGGRFADRQPTSPFYGYDCNTDPMFRFTSDGTLHYGIEMYNLEGAGTAVSGGAVGGLAPGRDLVTFTFKILLATSHDGGLTWPDIITWLPDLVTQTDFSRMAVSPTTGTVFEAINHVGEGITCLLLSTRDGGKSADAPIAVTPSDAPGDVFCRAMAVSPKGTVVVAFKAPLVAPGAVVPGGARAGQVMFMRSTDDGRTFTDGSVAWAMAPLPGMPGQAGAGPSELELAYDLTDGQGRGTLWAVTAEGPGGDADIFARSSKDDGRTWSDPVRVNHASKNAQYMPNLAIASDGSLHAFYFDRGYDPANHLVDISHAWSMDGGKSWQDERVTSVSWDSDLGRHQFGYPWIGDYLGVDAAGPDVWAGFPDTSLGGEPVAAAAHVQRAA
jgi:hypothetical protein